MSMGGGKTETDRLADEIVRRLKDTQTRWLESQQRARFEIIVEEVIKQEI